MTTSVSRLSHIFTGAILLVGAIMLATDRLEYCGQPEGFRRHTAAAPVAETFGPTLAPPQKVVFIRVEADKPDLEIGWAQN